MGDYSWGDDGGSDSSSRVSDSSGNNVSSAEIERGYEEARKAYAKKTEERRRTASIVSGKHDSVSKNDDDSSEFLAAKDKTPHPKNRQNVNVFTQSSRPIVYCMDHTRSFIKEYLVIIKKLALLGTEARLFWPDCEFCQSIIGDTTSDRQVLQVRDFASGQQMDEHLACLFPEFDGGDNPESYDLAAYFFYHHCQTPNAQKPLFMWILDDVTRDILLAKDIKKYIGDDVPGDINSIDILKKLTEKFNVYVILRNGDAQTKRFWEDIVGRQNIVPLKEPGDIIEIMLGIIAIEAGKYQDFEARSTQRHPDKPERIERIKRALKDAKKTKNEGGAT